MPGLERVARLRRRSELLRSIRAFFFARDFVEVETPVLVPSPGLDLHLDAFRVDAPASAPRFLSTSPEYQMKRLVAEGMPRIFQLARCFRRGEEGSRHNPEFTMLEWYRANEGVSAVMADTEQLVARLTGGEVALEGRRVDTRPPFRRMTMCEAFARFADVARERTLALAAQDEDAYFRLLVERVEPALEALDHAVFITEYPAAQASLARKKPGDPAVAERFELYVAGLELCNGFGELTDPREQRARFEQDQAERSRRGLPVYPIDERFIEALERGLPPSGGNALGVDRLVALVCGTTDIADVIAFAEATL